jgi:hypothetical protein
VRVVAHYGTPSKDSVRVLAFAGDTLAYGTLKEAVLCTPEPRTFAGWELLGFTDEDVLLGYRERGDILEVAALETGRIGLTVPTGRDAMLSPDGGWLAVATHRDRAVTGYYMFDLATTEIVAKRPPIGHKSEGLQAISRNGLYIAVCAIWEAAAMLLPMRVRARRRWIAWNESVHDIAFGPEGDSYACATRKSIGISRAPFRQYHVDHYLKGDARAIAFHPTLPQIAASLDGLEIWDYVERKRIAKLDVDSIAQLAYSPDGRRIACGHYEGTVTLVEVDT